MTTESSILHIFDIFECPDCQYRTLEQITSNVCISEDVISIDTESTKIDTVLTSYDNDVLGDTRYQCTNCGYILKNDDGSVIEDTEELLEWLNKRRNKND